MTSIDLVFNRSTGYRLDAVLTQDSGLNFFACISGSPDHFKDDKTHPLYGEDASRGVYHAVLQAYNSPCRPPFKPAQVAVKWVRGLDAVRGLVHEAGFYQKDLKSMQGKVVPAFYGCYTGNIDGLDIGCLVLEWCGGEIKCSREELIRRGVLAVCSLHNLGVEHGHLFDPKGHHFVMGMDGTVRIVDFSNARRHRCLGAIPQLVSECPGDVPPGCVELEDLEARIDDYSPPTFQAKIQPLSGSRL